VYEYIILFKNYNNQNFYKFIVEEKTGGEHACESLCIDTILYYIYVKIRLG